MVCGRVDGRYRVICASIGFLDIVGTGRCGSCCRSDGSIRGGFSDFAHMVIVDVVRPSGNGSIVAAQLVVGEEGFGG